MDTASTSAALKGRSLCWDSFKGLLISLVVFAHCLYAFQDRRIVHLIVDSIYFFHMPAFVFISGYFSKSEHSRSRRALARLLTAFLLLMATHLLMAMVTGKTLQLVKPYYSAWYLLALVVWRLTTPYFSKIRGILPLMLLVSLLAGFWKDVDNSFAIARIISLYPFFLAGFHLSRERANALLALPAKRKVPLGVVLLLAAALLAAAGEKLLHPTSGAFLFEPYQGDLIAALAFRCVLFVTAALCTAAILFLSPVKTRLPLLTKAGKNSLTIYLIHRPVTLILNRVFSQLSTLHLLAASVLFTLFSLLILGSDPVARLLNRVIDFIAEGFASAPEGEGKTRWNRMTALALVFCMLASPAVKVVGRRLLVPERSSVEDVLYRVAEDGAPERFAKAFRLVFAGDPILLEDQVKNAYTGSGYDFSECYTYTKKYMESADLAIGVFEGPCAGTEYCGYSSGNYDDGKT